MAGNWNPGDIAKRWQQQMAQAGQNWLAGINNLAESPTQLAATPEAMANYVAGCAESIQNGRRMAGLQRIDITTYKNMCQKKVANLATGANAAANKMPQIFMQLIPVWQAQRAAAAAVGGPRGTNSVAKFTAAFNAQMQAVGKQAK